MGVLAEKLGFEGVTYPSDTVDYSDEVYGTEGVWLLVTAATGNATATPAVRHHTIRLADTGTIHLADTRTVRI